MQIWSLKKCENMMYPLPRCSKNVSFKVPTPCSLDLSLNHLKISSIELKIMADTNLERNYMFVLISIKLFFISPCIWTIEFIFIACMAFIDDICGLMSSSCTFKTLLSNLRSDICILNSRFESLNT